MSEPAGSAPAAEGEWKRLHPGSVLVNLLPRAWRSFRGLWPFLLAAVLNRQNEAGAFIDAALIAVFFGLTVGSTVVHWLTLRYRIDRGRLDIETGLVRRQTRTIDVTRVQNVEMVRNLFQRMAGLVEVRIETASGAEAEGLLSALSEADAQELVAALGGPRLAGPDEGRVLVHNDAGDLLRYGATGLRFAQAAIGLSIAFEVVQVVTSDVRMLPPGALVALIPLIGLGAWLAGVVGAVLAYNGYTLAQAPDGRWSVDGGLFTRRRVEWRPSKVQMLVVDEPWLRRLAGFATVRVETAAASRGEGGTRTAEALVPVVPAERIAEVIGEVGTVRIDPANVAWKPAHPSALLFALWRGTLQGVVPATALAWFLWPWGLGALALMPLGALFAWIDARTLEWALTDDALLVRGGFFNRTTSVLPRAKVQAATWLQPVWWRRRKVARVAVSAAGAQVVVPPVWEADATMLLRELSTPRA